MLVVYAVLLLVPVLNSNTDPKVLYFMATQHYASDVSNIHENDHLEPS